MPVDRYGWNSAVILPPMRGVGGGSREGGFFFSNYFYFLNINIYV